MKDDNTGVFDHLLDCHKGVAAMLPDAMTIAIRAYQGLANQSHGYEDLKACQLHQAACKGALQHIELLIKLASALGSHKKGPQQTGISELMAKADDELNAYQSGSTRR